MNEATDLEAVFLAALEKTTREARLAYVEGACEGRPELLQRVRSLLAAHEKAHGPFDVPPPGVECTIDEPLPEALDTVIGPYKLLQQIGEGGMGTVFMAEQTHPVQRKVALKIIKAGMDSGQVIARFAAERQALALMDHPNIARVLDAGTIGKESGAGAGRPYFVMELVKGVPITKYCDEHHLTPRERLQLFVQACQAIQHAHQKGIIHRDLKPSNVLVAEYDDKPVVKVIDFGVAKATGRKLTERTMFTEFGQILGTLEYMSPEQAKFNALDIDTRSDIYSLGVLLYVLLTGTTPLSRNRLKEAAFDEMLRIIREEEPPKPSTRLSTTDELPSIAANRGLEPRRLRRLVRGELDWIVMKCLEKDRNRRYETANGLAHDLASYLQDEPVQACAPSPSYRVRKFVQRNKGPVLAAALVLLALVGAITGTTWGLIRAENARGQAEQAQLAEAEQKRLADQRAEDAKTNEARALTEKQRAEEQRERADQLAYARQLILAQREWKDNNFGHALGLLEACPANLRGWEHRHLYTLFTSNQRTFLGHISGVSSVSWSPNGKRLASASQDQTVKVWDAQSGRDVLTLKGHAHWVTSVCFSPDGRRLASASRNPGHPGELKVWDAETGQEILTLRGHANAVLSVCWRPDGKHLASASWDGTVKVWDAGTGQEVLSLKGHEHGANSVSWRPNGNELASGGWDGKVRVWSTENGRELLCLAGHVGWVNSVSWSPDGKRLASAGDDGSLKVWDPEKRRETIPFKGHTSPIESVSWSPDGKRLASAGWDHTVRVWDTRSGHENLILKGHANSVHSVAFSSDGKRLASAGGDHSTTLGQPGEVKVWDPEKCQEPLRFEGHQVVSVCWDPGSSRVAGASRDGTVGVWDVDMGQEILTFKGHSDEVQSVSWSPDGKRVASAGWDQTVKVWDPQTGREMLTLNGHSGKLQSVAWSPDGKSVASARGDRWEANARGEVKVWNVETGQEMLTLKGHLRRIWSVSWSPDGKRLASASGDRTVKVWDAITGEILFTLGGHTGEVRSVCFSPNGKRLASASQDQTVKVWDAQSGRDVLTLKGHTDGVTSVCFSPDGRRLTSASRDGTVKLWDTESGQETLTLDVHEHSMFGLAEVTWSPDGKRLAGCGGNGGDKGDMVMVWEDNPREELVKERRDGQAAISEFKKERTKWRALGDAIAEARQSEDPKAELSILEKAISEYPSLETTGLGGRKIALLIRDRNPGPAIAYGTHLLEETLKYDALALNDIAWSIVDPDAKTKPNAKLLKLGLTAAKRADELMHGKHAAVADTLAAAYAADGDLAKAAEVQAKAVALAKDTEFGKVKSLQERLERYKKALK